MNFSRSRYPLCDDVLVIQYLLVRRAERPQLVDDEIQWNRHKQVYDRRNRPTDTEEGNFHPQQYIAQNGSPPITDIGFAQALQFAVPVLAVARKYEPIIPIESIGDADNRSDDAAQQVQIRIDEQNNIVADHGNGRIAQPHQSEFEKLPEQIPEGRAVRHAHLSENLLDHSPLTGSQPQ